LFSPAYVKIPFFTMSERSLIAWSESLPKGSGTLKRISMEKTVAEEEHGAGEDGDDGEGDREIGEPSHLAEQLLRITKAGEIPGVVVGSFPGGSSRDW
jgi:hypothetical protein